MKRPRTTLNAPDPAEELPNHWLSAPQAKIFLALLLNIPMLSFGFHTKLFVRELCSPGDRKVPTQHGTCD